MELSDYLAKGGADKVNVVAISWSEGLYGNPSDTRLRNEVRSFHSSIRVIRADAAIEKDFAPLVYVPINFLFDPKGKLVHGDGKRDPVSPERLEKMLSAMN